ncbi:MAG: RbsD/FucU family protein, partial [Micrococcales bacterium]|nr:RbsD/FucU family protein [Micrococcales bacterium]
ADAVVAAICTVLPLDMPAAAALMDPVNQPAPAVAALRQACPAPAAAVGMLPRQAFYEAARAARVAVRTGERRTFGNMLLFKGVVA